MSSLYDRVIILCGAAKEALHSTTLGACLSAGACAALALLLASRAQPTPQKAASRRRKLAREIAEYKRIRQIRAGVPARQSQAITNKVDPIGVRRQRLLGLDNFGNPVAVPPASPVVSTP